MNALATTSSSPGLVVPTPRRDLSVRAATMADLPFLDALQKKHSKALGYFPTKQFEGYIESGGVLIAHEGPTLLGYCISRDRYLKRDELGVIYQLCVVPGDQRKLIGASLVREVFKRSAYGCRLYCCWCAQDLEANHFWESLGFVPIAFRAGSTGKRRVHIFWQRRTNANDVSTPYWYPSMTNQGAIREDRLVFPIPPGTHWWEVRAVAVAKAQPALEPPTSLVPRKPKPTKPKGPLTTAAFSLRFGPPPPSADEPKAKVERPKKEKVKIDAQLIAKARELRDRYLEQVNERLLIGPRGKYEVSRSLEVVGPTLPRLAG